MIRFFLSILAGNFASKLMLICAEAVALIALTKANFAAFAFLQAIILSAAVISVWGSDQALINISSIAAEKRYNIKKYIVSTRIRVFVISLFIGVCGLIAIYLSAFTFDLIIYFLIFVIICLEAQLILNAAILRSMRQAYDAILYLDGLRHLAILAAAGALFIRHSSIELIFLSWLIAAAISWFGGSRKVRQAIGTESITQPDVDTLQHAAEISKFSGLWSVIQSAVARLVILTSAYILSPNEIAIVAFFMKIMVIFTFLQTVIIQTISPVIGKLSNPDNVAQSARLFSLTTLFLAASVAPAVVISLIFIQPIIGFFEINWDGSFAIVAILLFAQALNIGTGIIGQHIIHFGFARQLLYISLSGVIIQLILLLTVGQLYGVHGILASYAISSIYLTLAKQTLSAIKIGFHALLDYNMVLIAICGLSYIIYMCIFPNFTIYYSIIYSTLFLLLYGLSLLLIILRGGYLKSLNFLYKFRRSPSDH